MNTTKITCYNIDEATQEMLIAQLSELGYEGFEQNDYQLLAYISEDSFSEGALKTVTGDIKYSVETIQKQNWNEVWESNFEPVIVDDLCTIRADFHDLTVTTPFEIVITPKMSFGTGHHATTRLMMQMMKDIDLNGKQVLDFGTGTGVLAILAEKMGAAYVLGIDNDDWSVENANENLARNGCKVVTVVKVDTEELPAIQVDVILANINRIILLQYMPQLFKNMRRGGTLLMSGLLLTDKEIIMDSALQAGFTFLNYRDLNNWITLSFKK